VSIKHMTPAALAPYIGAWCDEQTAAFMRQELIDAEYENPSEVPEATWDFLLQIAVRKTEQ
jgi:hypothetical protein